MSHFLPYTISWNLTRRCNQQCAHCCLSAFPRADPTEELSTEECVRVMDEMAAVNPGLLLILTGGEPLLRPDLFELAGHAAERGFTVVLGTNGFLLREKQAAAMRQYGIQGASISLDCTDAARHDAFRRFPGSFSGALRATEALRAEGLPFSLHMSVTGWNVGEVPAMIALARKLRARVLNLILSGADRQGRRAHRHSGPRVRACPDLPRPGAGGRSGAALQPGGPPESGSHARRPRPPGGPGGRNRAVRGPPDSREMRPVFPPDPVRAGPGNAVAQQLRRGALPSGPALLPDHAERGRHGLPLYARGGRKPPADRVRAVVAGRASLPRSARGEARGPLRGLRVLPDLRRLPLSPLYAAFGDYLAEDPACAYQPGAYGGRVIELAADRTFGLRPAVTLLSPLPHAGGRGMVVGRTSRRLPGLPRAGGSHQPAAVSRQRSAPRRPSSRCWC